MVSLKGLSSYCCKPIFTKRLSLIKAARLDRCQPNLAMAFSAFRMSMVIRAVHIWIITAFSARADKRFDMQQLLYFPEENLHLPAAFIEF